MTTPLDPVIAKIIPLLPLRDPDTMTPQSARDALRGLAAARAAIPPPPVASVEDIQVKGAAGPLAARVYRNSARRSPTVVFFHGGGWVAGDLETHDRQARLLAIETGAVVVSVDYRRPPETRFPGAFEDGVCRGARHRRPHRRIRRRRGAGRRCRRQRRRQSRRGGRDRLPRCRHQSRRAIAGLSRHRCRGRLRRRCGERALCLTPGKRRRLFPVARGHGVVRRALSAAIRCTASIGGCRRCAPAVSQALAPAVVCTAWFDPLRDEGKAYADALSAAGVPTKYYAGPGLIHGYFGLGEASETARAECSAPAPISRRCSNAAYRPSRPRIVNQTLTRIADHSTSESDMQRLRLKADRRIVELRDGLRFPLAPIADLSPRQARRKRFRRFASFAAAHA